MAMTIEEFVKRGLTTQKAIDDLTQLDAVATTGGKATVATARPRTDSMDKIRLKGGPKQYKSGKPGPTGRARLQQRVNRLLLDAARFAMKEARSDDGKWAARLGSTLRDFNEWVP